MAFSLDPDTLSGVLAIVTAAGVTIGAATLFVTKLFAGLKEVATVLKGIRTDQAAGDVVKVRAAQEGLRAQPGANPITADDLVRGTDAGPVRDAAVGILEKAAAPATPPPTSLSKEDREWLVEAILNRMMPPPPAGDPAA